MIATVESAGQGSTWMTAQATRPTMIIMTPPFSGTDNLQAIRQHLARPRGQMSVIYMLSDLPVDDWEAGLSQPR